MALDRFDMVSLRRFIWNRVAIFFVVPFALIIPTYTIFPQSVFFIIFGFWYLFFMKHLRFFPGVTEDCFYEKFFKNLKRLKPYPGLIYITGFFAFPIFWMLALNWAADVFYFSPFLLSVLNIAFFVLFLSYIFLGSRMRAEIYKVMGAYAYCRVRLLYPIRYLRSGTSSTSFYFRNRIFRKYLSWVFNLTIIYLLALVPLSGTLSSEFLYVPPFLSVLTVSGLFEVAARVSAKNLCGHKVVLPRAPGAKGGRKTYVFQRNKNPKPTLGIKIMGRNFIKL